MPVFARIVVVYIQAEVQTGVGYSFESGIYYLCNLARPDHRTALSSEGASWLYSC